MSKNWMRVSLVALVAVAFAGTGHGQENTFKLPALGGGAVSPDNSTLVVSLTAKAELVFFDTVAGKETKRVSVEFQPTQVAWSDKVLFVGQKSSGIVHILDADSGKELATGNAGGAVRNLIVAKGICFASTNTRQVSAIDAKGTTTKTEAQGTFVAADPKGDYVYTTVEGKATTDVYQYKLDGTKLTKTDKFYRSLKASLINVQGMGVSGDGKAVGVIAGGGWQDQDRKRHYGVPLYSTADMQSQLGEIETGAYPSGMAVHPVLPLMFGCTSKEGVVVNAKSYATLQKIATPRDGGPVVLTFIGKGQKLAWGSTGPNDGVLKFYDLQLTKEQQAELAKVYGK